MINAPRAIRKGFATLPVALLNFEAYLDSYLSQGIITASLIQRLSGFKCKPSGCSKSRNEGCRLSFVLYMVLMLQNRQSIQKTARKTGLKMKKSCSNYTSIGWKSLINQQFLGSTGCSADTNFLDICSIFK